MLYEASLGIMREVDRMASLALTAAARSQRSHVERDIVNAVIAANNNGASP